MPTIRDLQQEAFAFAWHHMPSIDGTPVAREPIHRTLIPSVPNISGSPLGTATRVTSETLYLASAILPAAKQFDGRLEQLEVLDLLPCAHPVLTFNTDGTDGHISDRHLVIRMHGRTDPRFAWEADFDRLVRITQAGYDVAPAGFWPPMPEDLALLESESYRLGLAAIANATGLVIVGYGFGRSGKHISDNIVWNHVLRFLRDVNIPIVVVDPFGEELVATLADELRSHNVHLLRAYWKPLAIAIMQCARQASVPYMSDLAGHGRNVLRAYGKIEDRQFSNRVDRVAYKLPLGIRHLML